jgi:lysophospholipid acyltransferase (LPLAT)-like uncharacterized protein
MAAFLPRLDASDTWLPMSRKRILQSRWFRERAGASLARYLQFVWKTSRFAIQPADFYERLPPQLPVIATFWHGQHFMAPFLRMPGQRAKVLLSLHRDGDMNAIAIERLGIETIRGSGAAEGRYDRKGGVRAFIALRQALDAGYTVVMTADVPKVSRIAGRGIVMLAQATGRPIIPIGIATSRRIVLDNWDRSTINLPFSRGAFVFGDSIHVSAASNAHDIESYRHQVEAALHDVSRRAYDLVDSPQGASSRA